MPDPNTQAVLGLHHVAIRCRDLSESQRFYEALGWQRVHGWTLPRFRITEAAMMQAPDGRSWIELFDPDAAIPMQGRAAAGAEAVVTGALVHLCLTVADAHAAASTAVAAGARLIAAAERLTLGEPPVSVRNALVEGPGGEVIELLEEVAFPGDRPAAIPATP